MTAPRQNVLEGCNLQEEVSEMGTCWYTGSALYDSKFLCAFPVQVCVTRGRELNLEKFLYHKITCTFRQVSSGKNKVGEGNAECCGKVLWPDFEGV